MKINNRRYIGCKTKLLEDIYSVIPEDFKKDPSEIIFADLFAGTGVVAYMFAEKGYRTIVNDILVSNVIPYEAFFSNESINIEKISKIIKEYNDKKYSEINENYVSDIYSDKYFSFNDAKKIGYIREDIEAKKSSLTNREYAFLVTVLLYAVDRIANTCGHFESFLSKKPIDSNFQLELLDIKNINNSVVYNEDANNLVKKIKCDIAYIDPPYNARQYVNFYHVLENIARWNKPTEFEGNSMKFKRDYLKSGYSKSSAPKLMQDLIDNLNAKIIVVSYNNTYNAKSGASNNKITEEQLENILKSKGNLSIKEIDYKFFNAGKTDLEGHKEKIYICEVSE